MQLAKGIKANTKKFFSTTSELYHPPESWGEGNRVAVRDGREALSGERHAQTTAVNRALLLEDAAYHALSHPKTTVITIRKEGRELVE